jgi:DNA helicase-2/ATP-dependent DNA helicase PcrA
VVFIAGMEQGIFPNTSWSENPEDIEEERRICYVGITRAMEELYITCAKQRMMFGRIVANGVSEFVSEIPEILVENLTPKNVSYDRINDYDNHRTKKPEKSTHMSTPIIMPGVKTMNSVNKNEVRAGVKIRHKMFGKGLVIAVKETSGGKQITVQFDNGTGLKNLILEAAPIEVI